MNRVLFVSSKRLSHLTIVIVDDNSDVRRFVGAFLAHLGANIAVAQSAIEGMEAIKAYRPDLVLSDISMPGRERLRSIAGYSRSCTRRRRQRTGYRDDRF